MLMVLLYGLATFMETALGVWIFSKMFPKRTTAKKKHVFAEWTLFTLIALGAYTLPKFFWEIDKIKWYLPALIGFYCIILLVYVLYKEQKKQWGKVDSYFIERGLFFGTIVWISWQYWSAYQSYSVTLLGNVLPVLFLFIFYKCTLVQAYLWEFLYITNLGLIKMVYVTYAGVFDNKYFEEFSLSSRTHAYSEEIYLLVVYLAIVLLVKYIPIYQIIEKILCKYKKSLFFVAISEWGILLLLMNFGKGKINEKNLTVTLIVVIGIMILLLLLLAKSFGDVIDAEKKLLDVRNEAVECQYRELRVAYEKYRCLVHDEKHMILFLRECLENGEIQNAIKFLRNYQSNINIEGKNSWTGISTLDFMLNIKKRNMDNLNVHFELNVKIGSIPMEDADFVVLLGNLFDNAIEAVEKCAIKDRVIQLSIQSINEMFILNIKNTSHSKPYIKNKRFITNKTNMNKHGCGIESVKHIVDKYNGYISFQYDSTFFEVSIIINEELCILSEDKGEEDER